MIWNLAGEFASGLLLLAVLALPVLFAVALIKYIRGKS